MGEKVIAFCGAFNPPTVAHLHAAQLAIECVNADLLLWVPSKTNYIREVQHKDRVFTDDERMEMLLKMLMGDGWYSLPGFEKMQVLPWELYSKTQPKTFETLDAIQIEHPQAQVYLLMGSDKLPELEHGWANIEYLLSHYKIIVLPRFNENVPEIIAGNDFLSTHKESFVVCSKGVEEQNLSSTEARKEIRKVEKELEALKKMLPRYVFKSILRGMEARS